MVELDLHISDDLVAILPALNSEEESQLEANILEDGRVTDPILFWNDGKRNVIVDGMHRFKIAKKHGVPYRTEPIQFGSREELVVWMWKRALGRRNLLDPKAGRKMIGDLYNALKSGRGGDHDAKALRYQFDTLLSPCGGSASKVVASIANVSEPTVKRDGKYAEALAKLPEVLAKQIETGEVPATEAAVIALAKRDRDTHNTIARDVRVGNAPTLQDAMRKRGLLATPKSADPKPKTDKKKPKERPGIKALTGEEAEAFDAREQIKIWAETVGRWLSGQPSIDGYRAKYPGKEGDRVVKAATELYEAMKKWGQVIK